MERINEYYICMSKCKAKLVLKGLVLVKYYHCVQPAKLHHTWCSRHIGKTRGMTKFLLKFEKYFNIIMSYPLQVKMIKLHLIVPCVSFYIFEWSTNSKSLLYFWMKHKFKGHCDDFNEVQIRFTVMILMKYKFKRHCDDFNEVRNQKSLWWSLTDPQKQSPIWSSGRWQFSNLKLPKTQEKLCNFIAGMKFSCQSIVVCTRDGVYCHT